MSTRVQMKTASPTRCPFCHDQVDLETGWVACRACLARHHDDCWSERGGCAVCDDEVGLRDPAAPAPRAARTFARTSREELLSTIDRPPATGSSVFWDYLGSLLSAGLVPALVNEGRLIEHARRNRRLEDPTEGFAPDSLQRTIAGARIRRRWALAGFVPLLLSALAGLNLLNGFWLKELGTALLVGSILVWLTLLLVLLARHHRAVRRHDASQLALTVRQTGLDHDATCRLVARHDDTWQRLAERSARTTAVAVLGGGLCFPLAWLTLPFWIARAYQLPLEEHRRRERLGTFCPTHAKTAPARDGLDAWRS